MNIVGSKQRHHYKRYTSTLLAIIASLSVSALVLAAAYSAPLSITESDSNAYTMLPVMVSANNQWLADNGFMEADALDTRVETLGGTANPHMVVDDRTLTALPVPADSQVNRYFTTGNSDLSAMDIIAGYEGYLTIPDAAGLELGNNFEVELDGYFDTDAGADKNLLYKRNAFRIRVSDTVAGDIIAAPLDWISPTGFVDPDVFWTNEANVYDDNLGTWTTDTGTGATSWGSFLELTHASLDDIVSIRYYYSNVNFTQIDVDLYYNASWNNEYQDAIGAVSNWETIELAAERDGVTSARLRFYNGGGAPADIDFHEFAFGSFNSVTATASGVSSGEHTILVERYDNAGLVMNGSSGYVDFGDLTYGNAITLEAYVYMTDRDATYNVWGKDGDANGPSFLLSIDSDGTVSVGLNKIGTAYTIGSTTATVPLNEHVYIAVRYDGTFCKVTINTTTETIWASAGNLINSAHNAWLGWKGWSSGKLVGRVNEARMYSRSILDSEVTNNYDNGLPGAPDDQTGLVTWVELDEGSGGTATDSSIASNDGTITSAVWYDESLVLSIDGVVEGTGNSVGLSILDSSYDWELMSIATPYLNSYDHTVDGALITRYEPVAIVLDTLFEGTADAGGSTTQLIDAELTQANDYWNLAKLIILTTTDTFAPQGETVVITDFLAATDELLFAALTAGIDAGDTYSVAFGTLPDEEVAGNDARITWGVNPTGVAMTLDSMVSAAQPIPGVDADTGTRDILPPAGGSDWFVEPDVSGTLLTSPIRPFVTMLSDTTDLSERQAWVLLGLAFVLLVTVGVATRVRGHHAITGVAAGVAMGICVQQTVFPLWALIFVIAAIILGIVAERSPTL